MLLYRLLTPCPHSVSEHRPNRSNDERALKQGTMQNSTPSNTNRHEFFDLLAYMYSENAAYGASNHTSYEIAVYVFLAVLGLLGNVSTCLVIAKNKSMHTVTNVYLFNLATSNLLILLFGFPLFNEYISYYGIDALCKFRILMCECSVNVSVLTITAFSIERYLVICRPFQAQALSEMSRAFRVIPAIWLLGFFCALPMSLQTGVAMSFLMPDNLCTVTSDLAPLAFDISTCVFFVLPMLLMGWLYIRMAISLRKSRSSAGKQREDAEVNGNGNKAIGMLVIVVSAFFVCWTPYQVHRLFLIHVRDFALNFSNEKGWHFLSRTTAVLYYSSGVVNPVIYNIMSKKFRLAFKHMFVTGLRRIRCHCTRTDDV